MSDHFQRRSFLLVVAATVVNLYVAAFTLDAVLSVVEEVYRYATGGTELVALRQLIALFVVAASFFIALLVLFTPPLPKLAILPLVVFAIWAAIGAPPLNVAEYGFFQNLILVLGQLALAAFAYSTIKRRTGQYWLSARRLPVRSHPVRRVLVSLLITIVVLSVGLVLLIISGLVTTTERQSAGYVRFTRTGIEVADRVFEKDGRQVRLVGMVHIGETDFYANLIDSFPAGALVLAEGVTDREKVLETNLSYKRVAQLLGLDQQPALRPKVRTQDRTPPADGSSDDAGVDNGASNGQLPGSEEAPTGPILVHADIDLSELSDTTIAFLNDVALLYDSPSVGVAVQRFGELSGKYDEAQIEDVFSDLIDRRNEHVLGEFDSLSGEYETVILPWGAMHMPGLERAIRDRGYELEEESYRSLITYESFVRRLRQARTRSLPEPEAQPTE